ncbi:DUF6011 domain-containing protein [Yimella lutea]|uniref:DUF6011 domain-containing protein n=1 Tax=Yimella lutea TaxID=587872 RepID=UPI003CCC75C6
MTLLPQRSRPQGDPGAAKAFGGAEIDSTAIARCRVCRHVLHADKSVHRLLGPVCARRLAALVLAGGGSDE